MHLGVHSPTPFHLKKLCQVCSDPILFLKPHLDPIPNLLRQFGWQSRSENLRINPNPNFNGSSVIFKFYWLKLKSLNGKLQKKKLYIHPDVHPNIIIWIYQRIHPLENYRMRISEFNLDYESIRIKQK
jgi:hypothetical protein